MFRGYPLSAYEHDVACLQLLREFLDCVGESRPFPVGLDEGGRAVDLCLACIESQHTGRPVAVSQ
jgi:hypothetical protein